MKKPYVIGLTGQTGAGKTMVSECFRRWGMPVINADLVARQVVEPEQPCLTELVAAFGRDILKPDGTLDRKRLAGIVFTDAAENARLGSIMYPYITAQIAQTIGQAAQEGLPYILLDAPTLFESGTNTLCDMVVSVVADADVRKGRILQRDSITELQAEQRMQAQHDETYFRTHSDAVLENNGTAEELEQAAYALWVRLMNQITGKGV